MDAGLQVGSHPREEGENPLPRPAGNASLDAGLGTVGFLGEASSQLPTQHGASTQTTIRATLSYQLWQRKSLFCVDFIKISLFFPLLILKKTMHCGQCMLY